MNNIKFSIIIPCYNVEDYIGECVLSVLNQTYSNWELLLVDDESTDNTYEILLKLSKDDERIRAFTKPHGGLPQTRNYALRYATGNYISLLDGDDYFAVDHLEKVADIINTCNSDMIIQNSHINFTNDMKQKVVLFPPASLKLTERDKLQMIFSKKNFLPASAVLTTYKLDFLEQNNLRYGENYKCSEDLDFFLCAISKGPQISFAYHDFYYYRQDNVNAMTKNITGEMMLSRLNIYKKWIEFYDKKKIRDFDCVWIQKKLSSDMAAQMRGCFELEREDCMKTETLLFFKKNRKLFRHNTWKQSFIISYYIWRPYILLKKYLMG